MGDLATWTLTMPETIGAIVVGYLIGTIPFGMILTRLAGLGDVRKIGSGNIGATNVLRTGNKGLAVATLVLDAGKGAAGAFAAGLIGGEGLLVGAVFVAVGHMYPVWLGFKGGKGVAAGCGAAAMLVWPTGLIAAVVWISVLLLFRISSLAALVSTAVAPLHAWYFAGPKVGVAVAIVCALIWFRHRQNIVRLLRGEEPRIGLKG